MRDRVEKYTNKSSRDLNNRQDVATYILFQVTRCLYEKA